MTLGSRFPRLKSDGLRSLPIWPFALLMVVAILLFWVVSRERALDSLKADNSVLEQRVHWEERSAISKDRHVALITATLNEVWDSLQLMQEEHQALSVVVVTGELQQQSTVESDTLIGRIEKLRENASHNEAQIVELEDLLGENGGYLESLRAVAERLRHDNRQLAESAHRLQEEVGRLKRRVTRLTREVSALEQEVEVKEAELVEHQETIVEQSDELDIRQRELEENERLADQVFFVIGTQDELVELGVLTVERKAFRFRKERHLLTTPDHASHFEPISRSETASLNVGKGIRKIQLLPPRPPSSYEFDQENGLLRILDKDLFWQSEYLGIVILRTSRRK